MCFNKRCFLVTAAMDCNSIELDLLNIGYEVFYSTLTYETLVSIFSKASRSFNPVRKVI